MSAILASAIVTLEPEESIVDDIIEHMDLPEIVKENLDMNLIPYLRAIQLDGYETYKKRKMMIVGNTSKKIYIHFESSQCSISLQYHQSEKYLTCLNFLGSGKTSLSASLKSKQAGLAKNHPAFEGKNLEETRVMRQWIIQLQQNEEKSNKLTLLGSSSRIEEYEWRHLDIDSNRANDRPISSNEATIIDSGGHVEYTLSTSFSITPKSLIVLMFDSSKYTSEVCYNSAVGCYIDIIMSQTKDIALLLVAGHSDSCSSFLKQNDFEQMKKLFERAKTQIEGRMKEKGSNITSKIKLISHFETKIFKISNLYNKDGLSSSQSMFYDVASGVLQNESIMGITEGNTPRLWRRLSQKMSDECSTTGNFCDKHKAFLFLKQLKKQILEKLSGNVDTISSSAADEEISLIGDLLRIYDKDYDDNEHLDWSGENSLGDDVQEEDDDEFGLGEDDQRAQQSSKESSEKNTESKSKARNTGHHNKQPDGENDFLRDCETWEETVRWEALYKQEWSKYVKSLDYDNEDAREFQVAIEYLKVTGEVVYFKNYKDCLFPRYNAFINTTKLFLDHRSNRKRLNDRQNSFHRRLMLNGAIRESTFHNAFRKLRSRKEFVDYQVFKEFLVAMGMAAKCYVAIPASKKDTNQFSKKRKNFEIFKEQNSGGTLTEYLIIPSLINNDAKTEESLDELYVKYHNEYDYKICYEFGSDTCLASTGIMELFLVQMYTDRNWDLKFLNSATSFKEPIEARKPGKVFSVEFNPQGRRRVAIVEEEICNKENDGSEFYSSRKINIFTNTAEDWNNLMKDAMRNAIRKLHLEGTAPQPIVSMSRIRKGIIL